jgi:hypothetical protein
VAIFAEHGGCPVDDRDKHHPRHDRRALGTGRATRRRGAAPYSEDSRHKRGRQAGPQDRDHNASMTVPIAAHTVGTGGPWLPVPVGRQVSHDFLTDWPDDTGPGRTVWTFSGP